MAESVKRRVAAARLAVAFVAAGAIAGGAAWAQAGPPPTAQSSAVDAFLKIDSVKGENVVDGSLLFKDFEKHQVPSYKVFQKVQLQQKHFQKVEIQKYAKKTELDAYVKGESSDYIKHQDLNGYIKQADADARYIKLSDSVLRGDGSVFTATKLIGSSNVPVPVLTIEPALISVNAISSGQQIEVTNTSGQTLLRTSCGGTPAGSVAPGAKFSCSVSDSSQSLQVISQGASPQIATLSFSGVANGAGGTQLTVQMLIGLL